MPRIAYMSKKFGADALGVISTARQICEEYAVQGYDLTLRQLYYQFVARGYIPNKQTEYKRLGSIINDARMTGLLDWDHLVDRTRNPEIPTTWKSPAEIIQAAARSFAIDKWEAQSNHVEVWIEKEALAGVVERIGRQLQVTTLACRGYMSQSEQWTASRRLLRAARNGKQAYIIHLGDHDPSGIDMTRDNGDRLTTFVVYDAMRALKEKGVDPGTTYGSIEQAMRSHWGAGLPIVRRIALNMDQVEEYNPPPNPAKLTDARANGYIDRFGDESWELDALPPDVLTDLIRDEVLDLRDEEDWDSLQAKEDEMAQQLKWVQDNWAQVAAMSNTA